MAFGISTISQYEPKATGDDYCSICKYYKAGWCSILLRKVNAGGWCRFFKRSNKV